MQSGIFIDVPLFLMSSDVYHAAIVLIITMIKTTMYATASARITSFNIDDLAFTGIPVSYDREHEKCRNNYSEYQC